MLSSQRTDPCLRPYAERSQQRSESLRVRPMLSGHRSAV